MATDPSIRVTTILLKARILAARLDHAAFDAWIASELDGYPEGSQVPLYRDGFERLVRGDFRNSAWSFPGRQIPAHALPEQAKALFEPFAARMPISEVEEFALSDEVAIPIRVPAEYAAFVNLYENMDCVKLWAELPRAKFRAILDGVRAKIIEYAIAIERANPSAGEAAPGERPVPDDQLRRIQQIFLGGSHIVTTAGGDVFQDSVHLQAGDLDALLSESERLGVTGPDLEELRAAVRDDGALAERSGLGPRVREWLGKMTVKAASGTWQVGSQAGAQVLASLVLRYYGLT